ncbi:MAG: flagellar biosynthesis anti-sigma factor FlgM [Deltaproteobacteria bacterium]|nr:flagellar biosynthesis anti-sigma factor FlgM [Deltaproteobacteria bacterium]
MDIKSKAIGAHGGANGVDQQRAAETRRSRPQGNRRQGESDTVRVSLGRSINSELITEREQRVAEIKALRASGQYNPPLRAVASHVATFIDDEIWFDKLSRPEGREPEEG